MSSKQNPIDALWDFFCSLKLTIITLILLAITSIIGTVIEQNQEPEKYLQIFSEKTYRLLDALQFFNMYHSWWFLALLGLFSINLTACSIKRFPRVWKTVHEPVLTADDGLFRTFSNTEELLVKDSPEAVRDKLCALFAKQFAPATVTEREGKIHLFAQKSKYARFGVYVTHASILIIFAGSIIGTIWGYKAYVNIVEGTQTTKVWPRGSEQPLELGFAVRCDAFSVAFYEGSQRPKEFTSDLVVLENGQEVLKKRIEVNHPLQYKGITFYQSSYGPAGDPAFRFRVKARQSGESVEVDARQGQPVALPGGGSFIVSNFAPSYQNFGPAAQLQMVGGDGRGGAFLVFQNHPEFDAQRGGDYIFSLIEAKQRYYTGLQVAKDPGVWVVWLGCAMLIFGSMAAFFLSHRRIWVSIQSVGGKTGIKIGGSAHRNQPAFELFFDEFKKSLKADFNA